MVLGRSCGIVCRGLVAIDGSPGEEGPPLIYLSRALPGLVEITVPELQEVPGNARRGVDQEGHHVNLGIPKVMTFVALPGEPLGRQPRALCSACRLDDLKHVEAKRLLGGRIATHMDITPLPEIIQALLLPLEQVVETVAHRSVQRALRPFAQLFRW